MTKREKEDSEDEKLNQIMLINKLATRLPWIIVIISSIAFVVIFFEIILSRT